MTLAGPLILKLDLHNKEVGKSQLLLSQKSQLLQKRSQRLRVMLNQLLQKRSQRLRVMLPSQLLKRETLLNQPQKVMPKRRLQRIQNKKMKLLLRRKRLPIKQRPRKKKRKPLIRPKKKKKKPTTPLLSPQMQRQLRLLDLPERKLSKPSSIKNLLKPTTSKNGKKDPPKMLQEPSRPESIT